MKISSIYAKTLYDHRKSLFVWSAGIILIAIFYASIYPMISGDSFKQAFSNLPAGMDALIGNADFFTTPDGFIHGEFFALTMPLIICIMAIVVASALIAREEDSGTLELLLARPVSRSKLIRQKITALITIIVGLSACVWIGLWLGSLLIDKFDVTLSYMAIAALNLALLAAAFGCLALMITALYGKRGVASATVGIYFLFSYIIGTFGEQVSWLKPLEPFALFHYFDTIDILHGDTRWWDMVILMMVCLLTYFVAELAFRRRDTGK